MSINSKINEVYDLLDELHKFGVIILITCAVFYLLGKLPVFGVLLLFTVVISRCHYAITKSKKNGG